jgi:hypothetical protein
MRFPIAVLLALVALLGSSSAARAASDAELTRVQSELSRTQTDLVATRAELATTREALERLTSKVDQLGAVRGSGAAAESSTPRLAPVNADNPAISFVVDTTLSSDTEDSGVGFALRSGELFISAPIDPFLRGFTTINGSSDEGFDIEEAAVVTTALPGNLTVKGGRFFADVGRMPHWHDEALPFVNRPPSIDRIIGGESGAEGVEVSWLAPIEHYVSVTAGLYNAIGAQRREDLMDNGFTGKRSFSELTFLVHPSTYFDLTDTLNLELGGTFATVPHDESQRRLYGVDATLRHQPGTSGLYQGLVFGVEWLWNQERFRDLVLGVDPDTGEDLIGDQRFTRNGGYGYIEAFFNRRYSVGVRGDYAEDIQGDPERQRTYSAFATWMPSEFHRLRLQYDHENRSSSADNDRLTLQWTAFMGSHSHGFSMR